MVCGSEEIKKTIEKHLHIHVSTHTLLSISSFISFIYIVNCNLLVTLLYLYFLSFVPHLYGCLSFFQKIYLYAYVSVDMFILMSSNFSFFYFLQKRSFIHVFSYVALALNIM